MLRRRVIALLGYLAICPFGLAAAQKPAPGLAELHRLDLLPTFKDSVFVGSVSSYDRTGGNDDGFSGKYSFVAKEGEDLVLADLEGPGVIYRIWTPTPTDDLFEFYFDGEKEPRIRVKFRDIFTGSATPFVTPLVGYGAGGFYSYVPLPYEKSCKIVARAQRIQFYQINFARYAPDEGIATWSARPPQSAEGDLATARKLLASAGTDITRYTAPAGSKTELFEKSVSLHPGGKAILFHSDEGGRIVGLRLTPASALAGKDRDLVLRIWWDGNQRPAVECPAGDFFGYAWGKPAMKSLLIGTADNTSYCYYPMPYRSSARIELVSNRTDGPPVELRAEVITAPIPRNDSEGAFYAIWRRENPTTQGVPFTFVKTEGKGHVVGCILQAQGMVSGSTGFFEGDDQTTLDGKMTVHGTGSEDFFNGGWYDVPDRWMTQLSFPLSGCLGYQKHLGRTGGYRLMLGDAYAFDQSVLQTIEHGPNGNAVPTDYVGVTYLYMQDPPTCDTRLPALAERKVIDLSKLVFTPAWTVPIRAFTFRNATLTKMDETLAGDKVSFLRMAASSGRDWFGAPFLSLDLEFPAAGKYQVSIDAVTGPGQATVQLFRNEVPAGEPVDLYAPTRGRRSAIRVGIINVDEGTVTLTFKLVGKNEAASGWGLDMVTIQCERTE